MRSLSWPVVDAILQQIAVCIIIMSLIIITKSDNVSIWTVEDENVKKMFETLSVLMIVLICILIDCVIFYSQRKLSVKWGFILLFVIGPQLTHLTLLIDGAQHIWLWIDIVINLICLMVSFYLMLK